MQPKAKIMQKIVKINLKEAEGASPQLFVFNRLTGEKLYGGSLVSEIEVDATIETMVVVIDLNKKYKAIVDDGI